MKRPHSGFAKLLHPPVESAPKNRSSYCHSPMPLRLNVSIAGRGFGLSTMQDIFPSLVEVLATKSSYCKYLQ